MPRLACWSCGRQVYATQPLESLFAHERRCPRCGAPMNPDRREAERRSSMQHGGPAQPPGPSAGTDDRRVGQRRRGPRPQPA